MPFAPPPPQPAGRIVWLSEPSADDIARAEGFFASTNTADAKVSMRCYVLADGRLDACTVASEDGGSRYEGAMQALKDKYRLDRAASGSPSQVTVTVAFPKLQDVDQKLVARPTSAEMRAAMPGAEDVTVALHCRVTTAGALSDCEADAPKADARLKAAALSLSDRFRFAPLTLNARPTEGYATVRVTSSAHEIAYPEWVRKPNGDDLARYYPEAAQRSGLDGWARMKCQVAVDGSLTSCFILEEAPAGLGFGDALLKIAPKFQMSAKTLDGRPVGGGVVVIPVKFRIPGAPRKLAPGSPGTVRILPWAPWVAAPTAEDVAAAFPAKAKAAKASGSAAIRCELKRDGRLVACEPTVPDDAYAYGFNAAAMKLSHKFRANLEGIKPSELDGFRLALSFDFSERVLKPAGERYVRAPEWLRSPDAQSVMAAYPDRAVKAGVLSGKAVVDCRIADDGYLKDCTAKSEEPSGLDFGLSGVKVASVMQANLWTRDGEAAPGQHVMLPLRFIYSGEPAPAKDAAPSGAKTGN